MSGVTVSFFPQNCMLLHVLRLTLLYSVTSAGIYAASATQNRQFWFGSYLQKKCGFQL